jgi:hypothetical protein
MSGLKWCIGLVPRHDSRERLSSTLITLHAILKKHARTLERHLLCDGIADDGGREPHARAALASGVHAPGRHPRDVLDQLGLG